VESLALSPDPGENIFKAWHYRRAHLLATDTLFTPFPPSLLFSGRQLVTLRPYSDRDHPHPLPAIAVPGSGAATTPLPVTCGLCQINDDLKTLLWDCPLYSETRTRTLATIQQGFRPTLLHAWACLDPSSPEATPIELWRSLLEYLLDPAAPPVGTRLQGPQLSTT
ncbi:hypothetical protein HPB47_016776, partial [Ixodes persulcatus]